MAVIEERVAGSLRPMTVTLGPQQHKLIDWVYRNSAVVGREDHDDGSVTLVLSVTDATQHELESRMSSRSSG